MFVRKRDKFGNDSQYKAQLVAQGFTQFPNIAYEETYSYVMDTVMLMYLPSLALDKKQN